ncbi:MAG: SGNH/GDSL hydrolase family protein, partial [Candidatus Promineifilaceae bacterium]
LTDHTEETEGRDFAIRQVKLFAATGEPTRPDAAAIYGDSLSADAFDALGPSGLPFAVKQLRGEGTSDLVFSSYGLSGQNSGGLTEQEKIPFDIYDALALDNAQREIRYWFVAIGTNDATNGVDAIDKPNTNINLYNARLEQFVSDAIARGVVPIVARIPDTDEAIGGWGDLGAKRHVLNVIDAVAAQYRLIPGPDLYADFRLNIETEESTYFGDDGTHHVDLGGQRLIKGWAEAFVRAFSVEEMRPLPRNGRDNAASSVQTATPETAAPTEAVATDNLQGASEFSMDVLESVMEVGSGETSAENSRPLWQAAALFGVLLLLSFGFVLLVFKKLAYI